jgi:hypothetical protein
MIEYTPYCNLGVLRLRRSKTDNRFFQDIPKDDSGKTWKKTDKWRPNIF